VFEFADIIKAAFLGVIEGLTEFIPVSSTAHLLLTSYLIDFNAIQSGLFEITIQFGAILAIIVVYRRKILDLLVNFKQKSQQHFILNIALAFLPAAVIGGIFHGAIKSLFFTNFTIATSLILGGIIIILVERKYKNISQSTEIENIKPATAFYIGLFQCVAMIPGVSRSGATIIGGILLGLNRKTATEFSFFLAIPTISAASFYDLFKNYSTLTADNLGLIAIGLLTSFFSAMLVIKWFISFVSKNNFVGFGIYRILLGTIILLFLF
jgi:undecaprenyl-diphosphatase